MVMQSCFGCVTLKVERRESIQGISWEYNFGKVKNILYIFTVEIQNVIVNNVLILADTCE